MMTYAYKAVDSHGRVQTGEMEAENEDIAISRLQDMSLTILALNGAHAGQHKVKQSPATRKPRRVKAKLEDLAMMSRQLAIMIDSGVPIIEALGAISAQVRDQGLRNVLLDLQQQVLQGHSFSQALLRHPSAFSTLYVDMVKTAEAGGELGPVMNQLAGYLEGNLDIIRKVKAAMTYPVIIMIASGVTVFALITFILPRFVKLFQDMQVELPPTTKALLVCGNLAINYWYAVVIGFFALVVGIKLTANTPKGQRWLDWAKLHTPLVGDLVRKIALSRSLLALGTLLNGGVPLITALETAAGAAGNLVIGSVYRFTRTTVESGGSIADAFRTSKEFPPLLIQMAAVGERAGELPELLLRVSKFYDQEVDARVKGLTSVIEPVMIVILGAIIGFIAVSIISPIYTSVGQVGAGR